VFKKNNKNNRQQQQHQIDERVFFLNNLENLKKNSKKYQTI
jgi:hypothetical protein